MQYKVLIVGAGQLGSRYLQGLSKVSMPLDIWVSDVSADSLARAKVRWQEVDSPKTEHQVKYVTGITELPSAIDLVIVATSADVRASVVVQLVEKITVRYWVLEKVLAQSDIEILNIQAAIGKNSLAWVNTPMYMWSLYKNIRAQYAGTQPINVCFEGLSGLACNAIHFIDFVSRWNKSSPIAINTSGLLKEWRPAKRINFYEVYGKLLVNFDDGSRLKIGSSAADSEYRANVKVQQDEWHIFESEGVAKMQDDRTIHGACEFQSQLTAPLIESILQNGFCDLPPLPVSVVQHRIFLGELLEHWNRYMPNKLDRLPIT